MHNQRMDLEATAVFIKVVQLGSFTAAAKALGMPNSTVSARVSALERGLGVTLLQRTTRKLHVTDAGDQFFRRCARALDEITAARGEIGIASKAPHGTLKLSAPVDLGHWVLPTLVRRYREKYPQVELELVVTNRRVDLIAEGIDVTMRFGELNDSSLVAKKMSVGDVGLWATPAYLKKHGAPRHPRDLEAHQFVRFSVFKDGALRLAQGPQTYDIAMRGPVGADDTETVKMLVLQDLGIGFAPAFLCDAEAATGRLVRVLPQWRAPLAVTFSFVYPAQPFVPPKVRALIDLASETFLA